MKFKIAILCAAQDSTYFEIDSPFYELDIYTVERPLKLFYDSCPVICHPPCAQWSSLRAMSNYNESELNLVYDCFRWVRKNGGIIEHPNGSKFMREFIGYDNCQRVNQSWFGFPATKETLLYTNRVKLSPVPLSPIIPTGKVCAMYAPLRSRSTVEFNKWLCDSVYFSNVAPSR